MVKNILAANHKNTHQLRFVDVATGADGLPRTPDGVDLRREIETTFGRRPEPRARPRRPGARENSRSW